jgi:hypothetical protein
LFSSWFSVEPATPTQKEEGAKRCSPSSSHRACPNKAKDVSVSKATSTLTNTIASQHKRDDGTVAASINNAQTGLFLFSARFRHDQVSYVLAVVVDAAHR